MTIAELIRELQSLPATCEVAMLTANAHARPPSLVPVNPAAWDSQNSTGLRNPSNAYLIRPAQDVI